MSTIDPKTDIPSLHHPCPLSGVRRTYPSFGLTLPEHLYGLIRVKEKWGYLTDRDLDVINGRRDQLEGKLQERYGIAKDQARKNVDDWFKTLP